jgi:hypothetical protein
MSSELLLFTLTVFVSHEHLLPPNQSWTLARISHRTNIGFHHSFDSHPYRHSTSWLSAGCLCKLLDRRLVRHRDASVLFVPTSLILFPPPAFLLGTAMKSAMD